MIQCHYNCFNKKTVFTFGSALIKVFSIATYSDTSMLVTDVGDDLCW